MSTRIHPTACIDPSAALGSDVEVGPYVVIGPGVSIGDRTRLLPHCHIIARTTLGADCIVRSSAVIGGDPQDLKFRGEETDLVIGDRTRIGEFVTINRGTGVGGGRTEIGNDCMLMAYVHIAHDCRIGNAVVITNATQLAGHIVIEDMAWISGSCLIHHFVTVGTMSFLAPSSGIVVDVPPYMIVEGFRTTSKIRTLNIEGLRRRNVPEESMAALKKAFKIVYRRNLTHEEAIQSLAESELSRDSYVANLLKHLQDSHNGVQNRALERYRSDKTRLLVKPCPDAEKDEPEKTETGKRAAP